MPMNDPTMGPIEIRVFRRQLSESRRGKLFRSLRKVYAPKIGPPNGHRAKIEMPRALSAGLNISLMIPPEFVKGEEPKNPAKNRQICVRQKVSSAIERGTGRVLGRNEMGEREETETKLTRRVSMFCARAQPMLKSTKGRYEMRKILRRPHCSEKGAQLNTTERGQWASRTK